MSRKTATGKTFESIIADALMRSPYRARAQVNIGRHPWNSAHFVDFLLYESSILVSLKYQGVAGTADEKIPLEAIALVHALKRNDYKRAYIVLAGNGWREALRSWYIKGGLADFLWCQNLHIVSLDQFLGLISRRELG